MNGNSKRLAPNLLSLGIWCILNLPIITARAAQEPEKPLSQEAQDAKAVQDGQEALSGLARFPWYDRTHDEVRRLHVVPRDAADSKNRKSKWTNNNTATSTGTSPRLNFLGGALQWIGLSALVLLLGVIAFLIAKAFLREEVTESATVRKVVETAHDVDRIEALPFKIAGGTGDFLSEARQLSEAGQYSRAIVYLFSYMLLQLDRRHLIRLAKGKTNRQYLRELRPRPVVQEMLEPTMIAFEDAFFGSKSLSKERFDACWRRLEEFHHELDRHERAAA